MLRAAPSPEVTPLTLAHIPWLTNEPRAHTKLPRTSSWALINSSSTQAVKSKTNFHQTPPTSKKRIPRELPVLEEKAEIKRMLWNVFVWRSQCPLQRLPNSQHSCGTDVTTTGEGKEMEVELLCCPQTVAEGPAATAAPLPAGSTCSCSKGPPWQAMCRRMLPELK